MWVIKDPSHQLVAALATRFLTWSDMAQIFFSPFEGWLPWLKSSDSPCQLGSWPCDHIAPECLNREAVPMPFIQKDCLPWNW